MIPCTLATVGLYGANFKGLDLFIKGLKSSLPQPRILWLDSGPLDPYLDLCDAIIWLHDEGREHLASALATGKPILARSTPFVKLGVPVLHMDDASPARELAERMLQRGARSIHYWGVPLLFSERRRDGARAAADAAGVPFFESKTLAETLACLKSNPLPAGLVCMNDEYAQQVCEALHETPLAVGRDVLLAGYDNLPQPIAPWSIPLSTVALPLEAQGSLAGQLLGQASPERPIERRLHVTTPPVVLERQSTAGPAAS